MIINIFIANGQQRAKAQISRPDFLNIGTKLHVSSS